MPSKVSASVISGALNPDGSLGIVRIVDGDGGVLYVSFQGAKTIVEQLTTNLKQAGILPIS